VNRPLTLSVLVAVLLWVSGALAAPPLSDAERLREGLPPGFRRPTIVVYPVLDARPLALNEATPVPPETSVFDAFVAELARFENLNVVRPGQTLNRLRARKGFTEIEVGARAKADEGHDDYKQVRLDAAVAHLGEAAALFSRIEFTYLDPRVVARTELVRGQALLEKGEGVDANGAFSRALAADPRLRLRPNYDRPECIDAFERARRAALESPPPPTELTRWPADEPVVPDLYLLRSRLVPAIGGRPERLEIYVVGSGNAVMPDVETLVTPDAPGRLAARVWASLPFGRAVKNKQSGGEVRLDAGFAWFLFAEDGLGSGVFNNVGAQTSFFWGLARNIGLQMAFLVANSGRDTEEDLRADILTYRAFLGPGYETRIGGWRFDAHLGVEVASPGRITTTDNVYCKHSPDDPRTIFAAFCPKDAISATDRTVLVGAGLTAGASLDLVDDLYLSLQVNATEYFYELEATDLGRPIGASLSLGYRFR
jgi:hypothetical protein